MNKSQIIFLSYVNRSGSTFLSKLLNSSEEVCCCPEGEVLIELFLEEPYKKTTRDKLDKLYWTIKHDLKLKNWNIDSSDIAKLNCNYTNIECFEFILNIFKDKHKNSANKILFKAEYLIFLYKRLGNEDFKWIGLVRDIRAVYVSQTQTIDPYTKQAFSINAVRTAIYWRKHVANSLKYIKKSNYLLVYYEQLLEDVEDTLSILSQFIKVFNLDYRNADKSGLNYFVLKEQLGIHSNINLQPQKSFLEKWKYNIKSRDLFFIQSIAGSIFKKTKQYKLIKCPIKGKYKLVVLLIYKIVFEYFRQTTIYMKQKIYKVT